MRTIVIRLFINDELPIYNSILFFNNLIFTEINKELKDIELGILDKTSKNAKLKSKKTSFTKKGLEKIQSFIEANRNEKIEIGYLISLPLKNLEYRSIDLDVAIDYSYTDVKSINLFFNYEDNSNLKISKIISETNNFLKEHSISINYGFGFIMENKKMPTFFAYGISTEDLTEREEVILQKINSKEVCEVLSVLFWLSIINRKILQINPQAISNILGEENYNEIDTDLVSFNLPYPIEKFDFNKKEKTKEQLRSILLKGK